MKDVLISIPLSSKVFSGGKKHSGY